MAGRWRRQVWDRRILDSQRGRCVGVLLGHTEGLTHIDSKVRNLIRASRGSPVRSDNLRLHRAFASVKLRD